MREFLFKNLFKTDSEFWKRQIVINSLAKKKKISEL